MLKVGAFFFICSLVFTAFAMFAFVYKAHQLEERKKEYRFKPCESAEESPSHVRGE